MPDKYDFATAHKLALIPKNRNRGKIMQRKYTPKMIDGGAAEISSVTGDPLLDETGKPKTDKTGAAMDILGLITSAFTNVPETDIQEGQTSVISGPSTGSLAIGGVAKGAAAGAKFGPVGAGVGAAVGALTGVLAGNKQRKIENRQMKQIESVNKQKYQKLNLAANIDPYGNDDAFYMEDGGSVLLGDPPGRVKRKLKKKLSTQYGKYSGIVDENGRTISDPTELEAIKNNINYLKHNWSDQATEPSNIYRPENNHEAVNKLLDPIPVAAEGGQFGDQPQQKDERTMVDVEKGEILIDPISLDVVREYSNPNRYKPHASNPQFEPVGNFTSIDKNHVVVSKKFSDKYKNGDTLARKSIVLELLKNQRNQPQEMTPAPQMADGGKPKKTYSTYEERPDPSVYESDNKPLWHAEDDFNINDLPVDIQSEDIISDKTGNTSVSRGKGKIGKYLTATNAARALNFLPTAYGIVSANRDEREAYDENTQFDNAKSYVEGMETQPSIEAARVGIRNIVADQNRVSNNINSPSVRAEVASRNADVLKAEGDLLQNAGNFAMDARNKKRSALADLEVNQGNMRYNARTVLKDTIAQNQAKKRSLIQAGLSEGITNFGTQVMDDNRLRAINTMLDFYKVNNDGSLADTHAFGDAVMEMMNSGKPFATTGDMKVANRLEQTNRDKNGMTKSSSTRTRYVPKNK